MRWFRLLVETILVAGLLVAPTAGQENTRCAIKGNISDSGRLYYLPSDPRYAKVKINRSGERWFCSEDEARAAGWEKAERSTSCVAAANDGVPDPRAPSPGCAIKGNQSGIYHVPGGACYAETTIRSGNRKEAWFCSEAEALAAGYRRSKI
ncbi:MAG: hypothetical protein WAT70_04185 [Rhizobiaceae bacterium]